MRLFQPFSGFLTGAALKALACLFMVINHIGYLFFPETLWLRAVGRLAMPIFAFFISEGCRYTRNKLRYFLQVFLLGLVCLLVYYFYDGVIMGNILITFSCSILLIYLLQLLKRHLLENNKAFALLYGTTFLLALGVFYQLSILLNMDYGFTGILVPVWVAIFDFKAYEKFRHWDAPVYKLFALFVGLVLLIDGNALQSYCLLALPLLACYNGKPGCQAMKYGFYLFYPLHLLLLEGLYLLLNM